jgi:hypothetical protein
MTSNGDNCASPVRTRGQWQRDGKGDPDDYMSKLSEQTGDTETKELVQDQIFHSFVEKVVNPNEGLIKEEANDSVVYLPSEEEEVPDVESVESDDSESEDEDEVLDDLATLKLEANAKSYQIFQALSPTQKEEAKKRFPDFWRTYQAVHNHTGMAYEQEDDPDFEVQDISESDESSDDDIDDDDTEAEKGDVEKFEIDDQEIVDLTNLVEEMIIPTEEAPTSAAAAIELDGSEDSSEDNISEDDEDAAQDVSVSEIIQAEMVSDDEGEDYKPVENGQESSEDSYESATSGSETDDDDAKMDE